MFHFSYLKANFKKLKALICDSLNAVAGSDFLELK